MTHLLVFEDSVYRRDDDGVSTDRAFLLFASRLVDHVEVLTVLGRENPVPGRSHYALPVAVRFAGLPHYPALLSPAAPLALLRSLRTGWARLGEADVVWLLGPHPLALALSWLAPLRRTRVVLGVRQDLPAYARTRHPRRPWAHRGADLLEAAWRWRARTAGVVAVGPALARGYAQAARLLDLEISLVPATPPAAQARCPERLQLLTVGRLETEKNPLMLADVLALLRAGDPRWHLVVCGEGPLEGALRARLEKLGVSDHADLRGYLPVDAGLLDAYAASDAFLHVSWTEGVPQVLLEAWACGTPVVATAVGGVAEASGDAALLVPPGNPAAAATAVQRVVLDAALRGRLVAAGHRHVSGRSADASLGRLAAFLLEDRPRRDSRADRAADRSRRPSSPVATNDAR